MAIMDGIMGIEKASVAHAKNTLSSLINKVAYGKTRLVLELRGGSSILSSVMSPPSAG